MNIYEHIKCVGRALIITSPSVVYDYKDVYDVWCVGVDFGKRF